MKNNICKKCKKGKLKAVEKTTNGEYTKWYEICDNVKCDHRREYVINA